MSFSDEYNALKKKKKKEEEKKTTGSSFSDEYASLKASRTNTDNDDIAPVFVNRTAPLFSERVSIAPTITTKKTEEEEDEPTIWQKLKSNLKSATYLSSINMSGGYADEDDWKLAREMQESELKRIVNDKRTYFQKGALEDGDVSKAILGTTSDAGEDFLTGAIGVGEKAVDLGANIVGKVGGWFGQDEFRDKMDAFVEKDLYDENAVARAILSRLPSAAEMAQKNMNGGYATVEDWERANAMSAEYKQYIDNEMEADSMLGEKSDSLMQSAGELAVTAGLSKAKIPWALTIGATAYGGEVENALRAGATHKEASISGAITAGAEILTEKLSGGIKFGGKAWDDALVKAFAEGISDKFVRAGVKAGIHFVGEGAEEVLSEDISRFGQWLTYEDDKSLVEMLFSEEAMDAKIEAFFAGGILGGGTSVVSSANAIAHGVDAVTGLTKNEQAVVDKVYQDELAEREQDGKKLTAQEKNELYDSIVEKMDKGYISTNTIEEVLGGETYKTYKDTIANEDAMQEEFTTLNQMKQGEMTGEQLDRRAELKAKLEELKTNSQRDTLKTKLGEEVFGLVQNDRLSESYREQGRRGETFTADLNQYDEKQRTTIQRAIDSGILNNTNRTHEFVDMIAKISADKGVSFDFTNNEKLKESGFAMGEGVVQNGFVTKDGITLNVNSAKALNKVVGHEVTHVLEGTEFYNTLQSVVFEYAKSKGEYDSRLESLTKLYAENDPDADPVKELTADLVGDYLFADTDFIHKLSTENRNVFQKIWDEVKYLAKVATAGSKEAKELAKLEKAFADAYRADGKGVEGAKNSLTDSTGKELSKEQQEYFKDSKVRDENGNLKVVYHGSPSDFNTFSLDYLGTNGTAEGYGFYFTDKKSIAENYSKGREGQQNGESGRLFEVYLDIKKPLSDTEVTMSRSQFKKFLTTLNNQVDADGERLDVLSNYGDVEWEGLNKVLDYAMEVEYDGSDSDVNLVHSIINGCGDMKTVFRVLRETLGYDGIIVEDATWGNDQKIYLAFHPEQIKNADNLNPTSDPDIRRSLSRKGETKRDLNGIYGEDIALAPVETVEETAPVADAAVFPDDLAPMVEDDSERFDSLTDADAPPEVEAPYYESKPVTADDPFAERDIDEVGNRKVKAYMYENPEVKPFFQEEARGLLQDLNNTTKGERTYTEGDFGGYGVESYYRWTGTKRHTSDDIAYLLDEQGYTYEQIEKGINAIIEDNGAENNAVSKRIEFILNDRLMNGYTDFFYGIEVPPNQDYINLVNEKQITEYSKEAFDALMANADDYAPPVEDIAPISEEIVEDTAPVKEAYEAIRPKPVKEPKMVRADSTDGKQRKWIKTSTESDVVDELVTADDIPDDVRYYQVKSNQKTLDAANARLVKDGYAKSREYFEGRMSERKLSVEDIALGERLIQEAAKAGDTEAVRDLIIDVSILGTELGQRVQALSLIRRLTPEGQLKALHRTVERAKAKGDKAFEGVEITQEMIDYILKTYSKDGTYDQTELNKAVEDVKQQIADQMKVTAMDYINEWRYLAMLGNPKTHIRNMISNVAMLGTRTVKNAVARTIEDVAPIKTRTKTWERSTDAVKNYAKQITEEMKAEFSGSSKYSDEGGIKAKRKIFKTDVVDKVSNWNSDALQYEDAVFSRPAFRHSLQEYLTANGIKTEADIENNPELITKAKEYAHGEARKATFQQDSYLANKIGEIERKNAATQIAVGSILPFKKTPINIAKTGLAYSPLGFARNVYDAVQVAKGNMDASEAVDHLAQTLTGSSLALIGYALATSGVLNGAGDDDKEGDYDYQLGKQAYSFNLGGATFSLSWLSPVAMPLFVGVNAYEQLVEGKEWNGDVVVETLAQTLDPLSEMSFISSLDSVLSSYDSGIQKFAGIGETMVQNYATQFVPTLSSQIATVLDDTKRTTKVAGDSGFKMLDSTVNQIKYKIPFLRETLEPSTDIWGNEIKQSENVMTRAFETFLAPYSKREDITSGVDEELKELYGETGESELIPSIPNNYVNYDGEKYKMSAKEYTEYKKAYGQTAYELLAKLLATNTYKNADSESQAELIGKVYDYAMDEAKREYFEANGIDFTNATVSKKTLEDHGIDPDDPLAYTGLLKKLGYVYNAETGGVEYYKTNSIVGAIEYDVSPDEYDYMTENPEKYKLLKEVGVSYDEYANGSDEFKEAYTWAFKNPEMVTVSKAVAGDFMEFYNYRHAMNEFDAKDASGESVSGLKKERVIEYINGLDLDYGSKIILFRSMYYSKADQDEYNHDIVEYLNSRNDISYEETVAILEALDMKVDSKGNVYW